MVDVPNDYGTSNEFVKRSISVFGTRSSYTRYGTHFYVICVSKYWIYGKIEFPFFLVRANFIFHDSVFAIHVEKNFPFKSITELKEYMYIRYSRAVCTNDGDDWLQPVCDRFPKSQKYCKHMICQYLNRHMLQSTGYLIPATDILIESFQLILLDFETKLNSKFFFLLNNLHCTCRFVSSVAKISIPNTILYKF